MFNKRAKPPTAAEADRLDRIHSLPCLPCMLALAVQRSRTEAHHMLSGGVRIGHMATIPVCGWHHRGALPNKNVTSAQMDRFAGPSLARASKAFHERFGTDAELLAHTNRLLGDKQ